MRSTPGRALDFLAAMIRFRSYSGEPGEAELARFMGERMQDLGLAAELQPVEDGRFNAIGTLAGSGRGNDGSGGKSLLFNGHMDTNPVTGGWTVDPWGGVHDDDFFYGIGVSNMKAGDAAAFMAVKTLVDAGVRLRGDVILEYVVGELQGGIGTVKAIEAGVRADCFVNMEPTDLNGMTLHAGSFNVEIELAGITRHVSKREEAVDAIAAAARLIPRFNAMTFSRAANRRARRRQPRQHRRGAWLALAGVPRLAAAAGRGLRAHGRHRALRPEPVGGERAGRYQGASREGWKPRLRAWNRRWRSSSPASGHSMLPFEVDREADIVRTVSNAYEAVRGKAQRLGPVKPYCFYGTDAAHLRHRAGMPGVVCGPGGRYNTMPDERVDIPDYLDMIRIYLLTILDVCGVDG